MADFFPGPSLLRPSTTRTKWLMLMRMTTYTPATGMSGGGTEEGSMAPQNQAEPPRQAMETTTRRTQTTKGPRLVTKSALNRKSPSGTSTATNTHFPIYQPLVSTQCKQINDCLSDRSFMSPFQQSGWGCWWGAPSSDDELRWSKWETFGTQRQRYPSWQTRLRYPRRWRLHGYLRDHR